MLIFNKNPLSKNKTKSNFYRASERGNVFFTLFGAVAVVGVLGAGIMSTMRGPLSTMVEVNLRERAKTEMAIASKLIMLESTDQANSGDCDSDGFVEPIGYAANIVSLTGGGTLPVGNTVDPWGNSYGYCGWDAGTATSDAACTGTYTNLLDGDAPTGDADYSVIAIISAGPDGEFQSTCADHATLVTPGGDDLVEEYTYEYATESTGGLWDIKAGDPDTAEIAKDLEVTGNVSLLGSSAQLQLGASSLLLPDQTAAPTCSAANDQILRRNTASGDTIVQICDHSGTANDWVDIGGLGVGSVWTTGTGDDIYYNPTTPQVGIGTTSPDDTLDVVGTFDLSSTANIGGLLTAENGLTVSSGTTTLGTTNISGATTISNTLGVTNDVTITGSSNTGTGDSLTVNNSDSSVVFVVQHDGMVGIGDVDPSQELDVNGDIMVSGSYMIDGYNVVASPNTTNDTNIFLGNSAGNMSIGGTIDGNTIVGGGAGVNVAGADNTVIGAGAGATNLTVGTNNILIGQGVDLDVAGESHQLKIGSAITGNLISNNVTIGGDLTVSGDDIEMATNTDGAILVANGTNFSPVVASGDAAIANDGTITIQSDAVDEPKLDISNAPTGGHCLKYIGGTLEWQACSSGGGGDGVGGDGLPDVLANDASANSTAITDLADPSNAQDAATKNYVDTQLGSFNPDRLQDSDNNTYVDVDRANDGTTNIIDIYNSGARTAEIHPGQFKLGFFNNQPGRLLVGAIETSADWGVSGQFFDGSSSFNITHYFDRVNLMVRSGSAVGLVGFGGQSGSVDNPAGGVYVTRTGGRVGVHTHTPDASAAFDIESTTLGFLGPRMTIAQRDAISSPATGLMVFTTDAGTAGIYQFYDGTSWVDVGSGSSLVAEISDLSDVDTTGAANNDILQFDGTNWIDTSLQDAIDNASASTCGTTWTSQSAAQNDQWRSVTYGNGLFVAVGTNLTNRVMSSPDGITWTTRIAAETNLWRSVTYGNGLFVAVASSGTNRVMTSPDGITWTARAAAEANEWYSVTYGGGQFVAVASTGTNRVMTSPDGITWTARTAAAASAWISVTYGGGQYTAVAFGGPNRVMTSPDGITWTARTAAEANQWYSVTYGNGQFVATSLDGTNRVMTSPDGITWTARAASEANQWHSVTYGNGQFVATSLDGTNRVMTSPDGITWTARAAAEANQWYSVVFGNDQLVAVAASGTNRVMTAPCTAGGLSITNATKLIDNDSDTQIQVEEGSDDDTIRFDTAGTERALINATGQFGIGTSSIDSNAALEVAGTNLGFLPPRNTDPGANITGTAGLIAYDSSDNELQFYNGSAWVALAEASGGGGVSEINDLSDATTNYTNASMALGQFSSGTAGSNNTGLGVNTLASAGSGNNHNVAIGTNAGTNISSIGNTAIGSYAMDSLFGGGYNVAIGTDALGTGAGSTANSVGVGYQALKGTFSSTGTNNVALGYQAGTAYTSGSNNLLLGYQAGNVITTGSSNIIIGYDEDPSANSASNELNLGGVLFGDLSTNRLGVGVADATAIDSNAALEVTGTNLGFLPPRNTDPGANITGTAGLIAYDSSDNELQFYNGSAWVALAEGGSGVSAINDLTDGISDGSSVFLGTNAGANDDGSNANTALGINALNSNTSGDENVALGLSALRSNTTGKKNIASGVQALENNTSGGSNTAIGYKSMINNTTGNNNTAFGSGALGANTSGRNNVAFGLSTLGTNTTGNNNIVIGYDIDASSATTSNELNLGGVLFGDLSTNRLGVGVADATAIDSNAALEVTGTNLGFLPPRNTDPGANITGTAGLIAYDSTDNELQYYNGTAWVAVSTGGGGSSLFTDNTTHITREGFHIIDSGETLPAVLDDDGSRAFYYPDKGAFRGGQIDSSSAWQDSNIGFQSLAWGINAQAAGLSAIALGQGATAGSSDDGVAIGFGASADGSIAIGNNATSTAGAMALGSFTTANGLFATASGYLTTASGYASQSFGNEVFAGTGTGQFSGASSGQGNYSIAYGLGASGAGTDPRVTGNESFGIFFGDQTDSNLTQENVLGLIGGQLLIDGTDGGSDTNQGCIRYEETANQLEFSNNCESGTPTWTAFGGGGGASAINDLSDAIADYTVDNNLFLGQNAGANNPAGASGNIAIGRNAFDDAGKTTAADDNTAIGRDVLTANTSGNDNTVVGSGAMEANESGSNNTAIGHEALQKNTSANNNTAIGIHAMNENLSGSFNVAIGLKALDENTSGLGNNAIGAYGLTNNSIGTNNTVMGYAAAGIVGAGFGTAGDMDNNTVIGAGAGFRLASGGAAAGAGPNKNILIGAEAGDDITTGDDNIVIGYNIDTSSATASNELNIGGTIYGYLNDDRIGIGALPATGVELDVTGDIQYTGTLTDVSDRRLKTDITPLTSDDILNRLTQIETYTFRMKDDPNGRIEYGVMAQELETLFPELVHTASDEMATKSVNYVGLIAPIIEATKELKAEKDTLEQELNALKASQADILKEVRALKTHTGYDVEKANTMMLFFILLMVSGFGAYIVITRKKTI